MSILWVEDAKNRKLHAVEAGAELTVCKAPYRGTCRFKNLNDFSNCDKCPDCLQGVATVYRESVSILNDG